ncbi:MAG TPA: NrfD/PsrC family molybdoenzyme membrane anchor subunit [Actinomycetota bacterium]|nr:NrfD/PsrC family molybdoenzyme membrane anchor subunit [Actinomycetota bacterium]
MTDRRNVDPTLGILEGEGAAQRAAEADERVPFTVWAETPGRGPAAGATYYDRPAIKEPVWIWSVPAYFYAGGMAGAAATLGMVAQGDQELRGLVRRSRWLATIGLAASGAFLVHDLGRPERFLNMLRVFRPTSPMSMGSWALAAAGPLAGASAVFSGGPLRAAGDMAGVGAGLIGPALSSYTGVLLSNTSVPVWAAARRSLPVLFASSSAASAASLLELVQLSRREERVVRRFGILGKVAELTGMVAVERETGRTERVGRPLREGLGGSLWRAAKVLTAASLLLSAKPGRSRGRRTASGLLGTAGAISLRLALFHAGKASARDPRATFEQQRGGERATKPS